MKKVISLILTVIMLMAIGAPAVSAADLPTTDTPIVFLRGASRNLYISDDSDDDSTQIFPLDIDVGQVVTDALKPCLEQLAAGLVTGNYDAYCDELYNAFAPLYEKVVLGNTGEVTDGSGDGRKVEDFPAPVKSGNYEIWDYDFGYDLRLSPLDIADDLKIYIDRVRKATGKKVSLVGRCFGGNVVSAYLAKYEDHAAENVESVVMYISSTVGIDLLGALFSGKITIEADNVDRLIEYVVNEMGLIEDPTMQSLITAVVDLLNYAKVLGLGTDALQYIVDNVKDNLVPRLALASYGSFPSYWSMVPDEYYEDAKALVFRGQEKEYEKMIAKLDEYHDTVQLTYEDVMQRLQDKGVAFTAVAKYDLPCVPVYPGANSQSDLLAETSDISFGATCANMGTVLPQSYIDGLSDTKYLSPDHKIDASTCLLPDKTWFIKNVFHMDFPDAVNLLLLEIVNSKGQLTVFDNESYPQYLEYSEDSEVLIPVADLDPAEPEKGSNEERFSILIRFITAILNFFTKLFSGELSLFD